MFDPQKIKQHNPPKDSVSENDFPIHTLENDLKKLNEDPSYNPADFSQDQLLAKKQETEKKLTEKQKTSPFLNEKPKQDVVHSQKEDAIKSPIKPQSPQENTQKISSLSIKEKIAAESKNIQRIKKNKPKKRSSSLKITLLVSILVLVILGGIFSIYYYKNIKDNSKIININKETNSQPKTEPSEEANPSKDTEKDQSTKESIKETTLSLEKPNFLVLTENQGKESLAKYANQVSQLEKRVLVEFIPVNSLYEPLNWTDFSNSLNIIIDKNIATSIDIKKPFTLFIFNDTSGPRLSLNIPLKNTELINENMKKWEPTIIQNLETLFLSETYSANNQSFQDNLYSKVNIRYKNLQNNGALSLDYAINQKNLLIATSKNATYALIEKFYPKTE
jgi:hypothetical protein